MTLIENICRGDKLHLESNIHTFSDDARDLLSDTLIEVLMDPQMAYSIELCRNESDARDLIIDSLCQNLDDFYIPDSELDKSYGPIVDLMDVAYDGTSYDLRPGDAPDVFTNFGHNRSSSGYHSFEPFLIKYVPSDIKTIVDKSFLYTKSNVNQVSSPLIRLDVISSDLYKSLIEHPDLLKALNWRAFEKLLADILTSMGFSIELQSGTKDEGIDLFAIKKDSTLGEHRYLLQAKRYKNKVGVEPVRQLLFLHNHYRATKSCIATTSEFTKGAWQLARQYRWQLELRDIHGITEWLKSATPFKDIF